jgi:hypothetical protein
MQNSFSKAGDASRMGQHPNGGYLPFFTVYAFKRCMGDDIVCR